MRVSILGWLFLVLVLAVLTAAETALAVESSGVGGMSTGFVTKTMNAVLATIDYKTIAVTNVKTALTYVFVSLAVLEIMFVGFNMALEAMQLHQAIMHFLKLGFIVYVWTNWSTLCGYLLTGFVDMASRTVSGTSFLLGGISAATMLDDPSLILSKGVELSSDLFDSAWNTTFYQMGQCLMFLFTALVIFISYLLVSIQIVLYRVAFALIGIFALVLYPFSLFKHTERLAGNTYKSLFAAGGKLFLLLLLLQISLGITDQFVTGVTSSSVTLGDAMTLCAVSLLFLFLSMRAPEFVVSSLLSGPQGASALQMMSQTSMITTTATNVATGGQGAGAAARGAGGMAAALGAFGVEKAMGGTSSALAGRGFGGASGVAARLADKARAYRGKS